MDNLFCSGREKLLSDCKFDGWGHSDCDSGEAAGVICKHDHDVKTEAPKVVEKKLKSKLEKAHKMELRLAGGRMKSEGRVEVRTWCIFDVHRGSTSLC
jgi:lysyl oxidase-like protein 2/3/4